MTDQTKHIQITDIGAASSFYLDGQEITVIQSGGVDIAGLLAGKIDSRAESKALADQILSLWMEEYDGDPLTNGLRVEVEQGGETAFAVAK